MALSSSSTPTQTATRQALTGVLLTVFLWGANVVLLKALLAHLNAETINLGRFLIAGTVLLVLAVRAHGWPRWDARTWGQVAAVGLLGNSVFQTFFLAGIGASPAGVAGLVNGVVPVLVIPLGLLLGQRPSRRQAGGVTVAFAGLLALLAVTRQPGTPVSLSGLGWLLAAATAWAMYTLWNRPLTQRLGALPFVAFSLVLGCLPYVAWALTHLPRAHNVPLFAWLGVTLSALGANVIAYLAWANGTRILGAARTSVWNTLAPAIALVLSAAALHERLPPAVWGAAAVILVGATLANWPGQRQDRPEPLRPR
ncbi:DMT family transporter [Deinococcus hopiensis]|uniref:DMT family transporter n=1 Tax=Deinococcus hopiensis TaxID=309885 RepID=UPI001FE61751|nr:DMT family transporter [Deinococcus hopiensis]